MPNNPAYTPPPGKLVASTSGPAGDHHEMLEEDGSASEIPRARWRTRKDSNLQPPDS